jgi:hypothetical protein
MGGNDARFSSFQLTQFAVTVQGLSCHLKTVDTQGDRNMGKIEWEKRFVAIIFISLIVISLSACIAAVPLIIKYAKGNNQTVAKAEMPVPAEKVYSTTLSMAEERGLRILKREDDRLFTEVTDGIQTASLKAEEVSPEKSRVTITATLTSEMEKEEKKKQEKELALRIIDRLCERLDVKCTVEEE